MKNLAAFYLTLFLFCLSSCISKNLDPPTDNEPEKKPAGTEVKVTKVSISGTPGSYTFNVTLESPDTGCDQYADWWEVFSADSTLLYRRILAHSHVNEQPFTRGGGTIDIQEDDFVFVRGHMNNLGYGSQVFSGTIKEGLKSDNLDTGYAAGLASQTPLPGKCDF